MEAFRAVEKKIAVVLAAGKSKRTHLTYSKVLLPLCGKPMISWVSDALQTLNPAQIIVVASPENKEKISEALGGKVKVVVQEEPLGTGHAIGCALKALDDKNGTLVVACGDTPLLSPELFQDLLRTHRSKKGAATVLTALLPDASGYGRIVKNRKNFVVKIVEEKDAPVRIKKIREINSGTYCFELDKLRQALSFLTRNNRQNEYYLTDCVAWLSKRHCKVLPFLIENSQAALGVNTLKEFGEAHKILNNRLKEKWLDHGVIFIDDETVQLDHDVVIGAETMIYPYTILEQGATIGSRCKIGPFTRVTASQIGDDSIVQNAVLLSATTEEDCKIGPFAYLRPGTRLRSGAKIGNFVEIKNSTIGQGSKVPHLSYVGDATIGQAVNIGAGVITCNYDGKGKYPTIIEDGAFIGSNSNLRAPVRIGKNAVTGAGSTVIEDVPAGVTVAGVPAKPIKSRRLS